MYICIYVIYIYMCVLYYYYCCYYDYCYYYYHYYYYNIIYGCVKKTTLLLGHKVLVLLSEAACVLHF